MNQKIIDIAKIVFALIFVVLLAVMMGTISSKGNAANTQLVDTLEMTSNQNLDRYANGAEVSGEAVVYAINNVDNIGGNTKMCITVKTKANLDPGVQYGYVSDGASAKRYTITDTSDNNYINTSARFTCKQDINGNGVITGLTFTQQ